MTEINRMKAMVLLRQIDDNILQAKSEGKTEWSEQEVALIEEKRKVLDRIIAEGKGEYDEDKYGVVERGYSNIQ